MPPSTTMASRVMEISDEAAVRFAEEFCLFGTAEHIAERLRALHAQGVTGVFLQHVGSYAPPTGLIEAVGSAVLPALVLPSRAQVAGS